MIRTLTLVLVALLSLNLTACGLVDFGDVVGDGDTTDAFYVEGTVDAVMTIGGGSSQHVLRTDAGDAYTLTGIDAAFLVQDLRLRVLARLLPDANAQQFAPAVEVLAVEVVDERWVAAEAVVTFVPVEGGFWGLVTDSGQRYLPINLDASFERGELRVRFAGTRIDQPSFRMWGQQIELLTIEEVR